MKIYFVTENKRKVDRAKWICRNSRIEIEQLKMEVPEIQATDSCEVAQYAAEFAGRKLRKPVVKLDVSFQINALNGFPGPFVKYVNQWLKPEDILKMLEGVEDRSCYWVDCLAFYNQGQIKMFTAKEVGTIANEVKGENGWGMDKIFIPRGQRKTKAELSDPERIRIYDNGCWRQLMKFISDNE